MFEMDSDPEVHRYLGNRPVTSIDQTKDVIAFVRKQYLENGIGRWAVALKDSDEFIGWTGFKLMDTMVNGHINHYDFGYRHARKYWRQGYAFEAAKAARDYGIESLGIKEIYAMTQTENAGSRRILEKLEFRLDHIFPFDGEPFFWLKGQPTTWYVWEGER